MSRLCSLSVLLFLCAPAVAQLKPTDWPQFRGPTGQGVSAAKGLPSKWSQTENLAWKTPLPGPGTSSPIVLGDKIYLTCYSGFGVPGQRGGDMAQLKLHLVCASATNGKIAWTKDIAPKLPEQDRIRDDHGYASSTPATDGERVYCFFGKSGVFAFDLDGNQLWTADVGSQVNGFGTGASPVVAGNLLIVNASVESQTLFALDKKTGREVWKAKGIREAWNTPVLMPRPGGKSELVLGMQGKGVSCDPATGDQLWTCANDITWYIVPSVVTHDDTVWSIGGRSGVVACAVKAGGKGDVTKSHRQWTSRVGSNVTSPVYHDGHLYWMNDNLGIAYCAEAATGKIVYEERMDRPGQVYASALLADGKVYYLTRDGRTLVLAATPKFERIGLNDLGDRSTFNASPAVAGNKLLIRSDKFLYCVGK